MDASVSLSFGFEDQSLFDQTIDEYARAVERGELSEDEAIRDATALVLGMLLMRIA